jgi:hypothetical protein
MYNFILSFTSLLMLLPLLFLKYKREKNMVLNLKNPIHYLELLLIITLLISIMHWLTTPAKISEDEYSILFIIDGYLAKLSAFIITIYVLFIKKIDIIYRLLGFIFGICAITAFYHSSIESKIAWCSEMHILYHAIFHINCIFILYIAFL